MTRKGVRPEGDRVGAGWAVGPGDGEGHVGQHGKILLTGPACTAKHVVLAQPLHPGLCRGHELRRYI